MTTPSSSNHPGSAEFRQETHLHRAHAALLQLAHGRSFSGDNLIEDLHRISEVAARALDVGRASVWLYDQARTKIRCIDLFELATGQHSDGMELLFRDHPAYFLALDEKRLIVAHDARSDPTTREYTREYLEPHGITSMLDAAARLRGQLVGVICLEHVGPPRRWTTEEEVFACALADLVSLALEAAERQVTEVALRESEERFREIFENTRDAIVLIAVRPLGRFVCEAVNAAAEAVSGLRDADIRGKIPHEIFPATVADKLTARIRECLDQQTSLAFEHQLPLPTGPRWFSTLLVPISHPSGGIYRIAGIARDVTDRVRGEEERQRLQTQLHQAQKLEALGTLAGGVAHDFNNLLTVILGQADLLYCDVRLPAELLEQVNQIRDVSVRSRDLIKQILMFSRNDRPVRKPIVLGPIIQSAVKYMRVTMPPGVRVTVDVPAEEPRVLADPTQMHQVILNLCTNAVQAMSQGGELLVSLDTVAIEAAAIAVLPLSMGRYVRLTVRDTGCGMDEMTRSHLFEPFFTTKPPGQGTGLGLAVVHGIVQKHDGAIVVTSQPNQGSTFQVYLPLLTTSAVEATLPVGGIPRGKGQHVLFVDDQEFITDIALAMLRGLGYQPATFTDPARAVAAFRLEPSKFHLVITDFSMPKMTGFDLVQQIKAIRSDVPVILISGFDGAIDDSRAALMGIREIIHKPFTLERMASVLHQVLTGTPSGDLR